MTMTFAELQTKMQITKTTKQGVKYTFRNAEDIFTHFKTLNSGWELTVSDELVELIGRIFIKATATARIGDEQHQATRYAELDSVPVLNTKDYKTGEPKQVQQMQVPQWTGAVSSYAGKYALQGLFGIGEEDVDAIVTEDTQRKEQKNSQPTTFKTPKISNIQVETYKSDLNDIAKATNQNVEELTKWLTNTLKVKSLEDLRTEQIVSTDDLINKLKKRAGQKND
ncbi:ERF family protein [Streptococcus pyogenes]|uniref:ERF family protein n=1 Tax=Streptococcus pyogenes TaxID=1314 RepID=UPI000DA38E68|nr:ERF family protein [Streptococcus pyogenes]QCK38327.1 single-stranded DNA-binding protein [Streptococcus pyogenes]QCK61202.1 single-stranded DNA-binding protein [Streptococcus pyogenes]SQF13961.1 Recombination protein [Streptococcus pyogenes]VGQ31243.1 Recombination protein [Streptococcus pyogenes]VGQ78087.1 Recombination protein [Streptococcus pyogenes]